MGVPMSQQKVSYSKNLQCAPAFAILQVLIQAWPYFGTIMEKTFKEVLEPKIRAKSVHLKTCTFTKIHFGEKVVRIFYNTCGSLFPEKFGYTGGEMFISAIACLEHLHHEGRIIQERHTSLPTCCQYLGIGDRKKGLYAYLILLHPSNSFQCFLSCRMAQGYLQVALCLRTAKALLSLKKKTQ